MSKAEQSQTAAKIDTVIGDSWSKMQQTSQLKRLEEKKEIGVSSRITASATSIWRHETNANTKSIIRTD